MGQILDSLHDRSLQRQLMIIFGCFALVTVFVGLVGAYSVSEVSESADRIVNEDVTVVDGAMEMRLAVRQERSATHEVLLGEEEARSDFEQGQESFNEWHSRLSSRDDLTERESQLLQSIKQSHDESIEHAENAMELKAQDNPQWDAEMEEYDAAQSELVSSTQEFEEISKQRLDSSVASAQTTQRQGLLGVVVLTLIAVGGAILGGRRFGNSLGADIRRVRDRAEKIAAGTLDFTAREAKRGDEIGDLNSSFTSMQGYLQTVSRQARAVADQQFDADVLDEDVPGELGEAMNEMATNIKQAQREAKEARANVESMNNSLKAEAADYRETMERAAEGDFTQRMDPESESEAMVQVAQSFNEMMDELENTLIQIREFANEVAAASEEVTTGTEESKNASEQVSESIQAISADAESQSENLQEVAGEMQSLSGTVEEVASSANEIASTSEKTAELGQEGQEAAGEAMDEMVAIKEKSDETTDKINSLATEIEEVGEVVELITDIAEQTNMLALNASIEAARAGEAGEGFAVVADEIKGLAGDVSEATEEVESLITEIQASTDTAVEDIQEMGERVSSGTETIGDALDSLDDIAANVEEANQSIQEINTATDDQAASTEEVASMVDEVAHAAEQVSDESENVSTAAEEQASSLSQVSQTTQTLAQRADDLQGLLQQFTVGTNSTDPRATSGDIGTTATDGGAETATEHGLSRNN